MDTKEEIWKPVKGYEGLYEVSNLGRVRSLNYMRTGKVKVMKLQKNIDGYLYIHLHTSKNKYYRVNRLVYNAFKGDIPEGMQVNHIDENILNNCIDNLNLMTGKENVNWGTRNKRMGVNSRLANIKNGNTRLVVRIDEFGCAYEYDSELTAEKETGIKQASIWRCCNGKQKTAGGYRWMYFTDYLAKDLFKQDSSLF